MVLHSKHSAKGASRTMPLASRSLTDRILNTTQDHSRRRRRTSGGAPKSFVPTNTPTIKKSKDAPRITFDVRPAPTLAGGAPRPSGISLPRTLKRFDHKPVDMKNVLAIQPNLKDTPLPFIIEEMETYGKEFIKSIKSIQIRNPPTPLPNDIEVIVNEDTDIMPSHIIGVTAKAPKAGEHVTVTLFPAFDLVFAINCGNMPAFPPAYPVPEQQSGEQRVKLPLLTMAVPAPASFGTLTNYLYSKNTKELIRALFPVPPPAMIEEDPNELIPFATHLAETFTSHALLKAVAHVFGFWQNVCAFGVSDARLWSAMDLLWQTLLTSLAISSGSPQLMIPDLKKLLQQEQSAERSSTPVATPANADK